MSAERLTTIPRPFEKLQKEERKFTVPSATFIFPGSHNGPAPAILTIRESHASELMQLFLVAYEKKKPVYLSEIEDIYNSNPQNKTKLSMALARSQALGGKNNLNKTLRAKTPWTISSPDVKLHGNHIEYTGDNPSFYLKTRLEVALGNRKQKKLLAKRAQLIKSSPQEEQERKAKEAENEFYKAILFRFAANSLIFLPTNLGELYRRTFTNGSSNPFLGKSKNELNRYFADKFRRRLEAWWDIEDTGNLSETEKQAVKHCRELKDKGYTTEELLDKVFAHFSITTTSSQVTESPKG